MTRTFRRYFRHLSIQTKFLLLILPLIIIPVLILGVVGFVTASQDATTASSRYLKQRENDLRALSENPAIRDYHNNKFYGLNEEADVYRQQIEQSLKRFAVRTNDVDLVYPKVRYVDDQGVEVAAIIDNEISRELSNVADEPYFEAVSRDPGDFYSSPIGESMVMAIPVYEFAGENARMFQGAVVLDFVLPIKTFERITAVIARTLIITTVLSLGVAIFLVVRSVRSLTQPIRGLAGAADVIAEGGTPALIDVKSADEVGRLATSFNDMTQSLQAKEEALKQKVDEATSLYQIGKEITAHVALEPTLSLIVERARDLLGADRGLLALRAEESDTFEMRAASDGLDKPGHPTSFRLGEGMGGHAVALGETILVGDYAKDYADSPFAPMVSGANFHSAIA
ncbi:MAG: HAMP domain-containing protein, partial [Geminicoccaceae bacterium]